MIIIGIDPHPATFTAAVLDASTSRVLATLEVQNTHKGHQRLLQWAKEHSAGGDEDERRWAVEGAGNPFVAQFVVELLERGESVTDISPSLTSQYRARRGSKKNDEVDAHNAARALLANPRLPAYAPSPDQRRLQVITRNRARLAGELKANRMALKALPAPEDDSHPDQPRDVLQGLVEYLAQQIKRLDAILGELLEEICPEVLKLRGVGAVLGAVLGAVILAEVGNVSRFEKESAFASYCGAAPVSRGSGKNNSRVVVNSGGNRRMNYVLHMMAQVRLRTDPRSRELFERKQREGKTKRAALRVLKTYIARELYRKLKAFERNRQTLAVEA